MSWIKEITYDQADGPLKKIYDRVKAPNDQIDNILRAHSLRPHTLAGHMALYKNVLHHARNTLPKWYLETIGVYVSYLNQCHYCVDHHYAGLGRLLGDDQRSEAIMDAIKADTLDSLFEGGHLSGLRYAHALTRNPQSMEESYIKALRDQGLSDGEILEINQVVSYFNYANRTVLGLGVHTGGETLGLSPNDNDDEKNWGHA